MGSSTIVKCCTIVICCSLALISGAEGCNKQWLSVIEEEAHRRFAGGLSSNQLALVASSITGVQHQLGRPANLLVFSAGEEFTTWKKLNCVGKTVFLDDNANWRSQTRSKLPGFERYQVEYAGSVRNSREFYSDPWMIQLPEVVANNCWDVIYVDSPAGFDPPNYPGRMESTYAAINLAEQCINTGQLDTAFIYLHDAKRSADQEVVQQLLLPHPMVQQIGTMKDIVLPMQIAGFVVSKHRLPPLAHDAAFAAQRFCRDRCSHWADVVWDMTQGKYGHKPQMSTAHVAVVAASVRSAQYHAMSRPNLLVFGVGYDSVGWSMANNEGRTVFLEDNDEWLHKVAGSYPHLEISKVSYTGDMRNSGAFFDKPWLMDLPATVTGSCWNTILVDAPMGYALEGGQPGRMESSYAAIKLAEQCIASGQLRTVTIFLHDAGRPLEQEIMRQLFAAHPWVESMGVLNGSGVRHLAGYVMTQQQQPEMQIGSTTTLNDQLSASVTDAQGGAALQRQQQKQTLHITPKTMVGNQRAQIPNVAVAPAANGGSSRNRSVPEYPLLSHLGYLLLGMLGGLLLRSYSKPFGSWFRCLGQKRHVPGPMYIPIRSS